MCSIFVVSQQRRKFFSIEFFQTTVCHYQCHVCICRAMQLDYESTSALLLPNRNGDDDEYNYDDGDDNDEYIIYLNL